MEFVNEILENIWKDRYRKNNETLDDNFRRVAKYIGKTNEEVEEFYNVMKNILFLPAGRTMSNSGIGRDLTLNNCFIAGTKVLTKRGYINIEEVKVGDEVITEDNSWQRVNEVMCRDYNGDLFKISANGLYDDIICTPNHQFLTLRGWTRADRLLFDSKLVHAVDKLKVPTLNWKKTYEDIDLYEYFKEEESDTKRIKCSNDESQICIEELCSRNRFNDNIAWTKQSSYVNRYLRLTPDFRYLIGRWIGDGSITRYKGKRNHSIVQIVFNAEKERDAAKRCKDIGDKIFGFECSWSETKQNVISLRWCSEILGNFFFKEFGEKCDGKFLGNKYIGDIEIAKGIMDADGFINTHGGGRIVLKNKNIISWLRDTLFLNGFNPLDMKIDKNHENTYELRYSPNMGNRGFNQSLMKDFHDKRENKITTNRDVLDYIAINNVEIIENQCCKVYNLSVENIHSYVVNGVVAHNCFVAPQIKDDLSDIFNKVSLGAKTHQKGGGIGYDFSQLRPKGSPTSNDAIASGAISFMDVFNAQTATILQGNRRGANMGVMSVYNMDIEDFITAKSYDEGKLNHFNVSVMVDNDFITAVKNNENVFLHYPVYNEDGKIEKNPNNWIYKKEVSAKAIWDSIMQRAYDNGEPGIFFYDNLNNDNNLWYVENIVCSNPCAEYLAGTIYGYDKKGNKLNPNDFGGACNLGSLFLHNFIVNPFMSNARIDYDKLRTTIYSAVRMLDNIIDINNFPDKIYENYQKSFRTIGLGITGLADALAMMGIKYNSPIAKSFVFDLMNFITLNVYKASIELSKERGEFPLLDREKFVESGFIKKHCDRYDEWKQVREDILKHGIRNSKMISVAPTGTLSLTFGNNCSSGLEPIFSLEYERKVKMGGQSDDNIKIIPMRDYAYGEWLKVKENPECVVSKDVFVTALEMTVDEHVDMLASIAYHVDMSCSKTINVPSNYSFEDTKKIYEKCHDLGIKGCTIFRPNEIRQGIMITENSSNETDNTNQSTQTELPRGYIIKVSDDLVGYKRKLNTGCGSIHLEVYSNEDTGEPQETFINIGSGGGCERNYQFISRLMSLALRAGVPIESIIDQAMSIRPCMAYVNRTKTKNDTSAGTSCPSAIGYALKDLQNKIYNTYVVDCCSEDCNTCDSIGHTNVDNKARCPECGEKLSFEGGCNICKSCGWSKCS